ncbi:MAG: PEP-CTERM sorting domain-containing protein [Aquincola tertiaricarbonis]
MRSNRASQIFARSALASALALLSALPVTAAESILFIGNSFTYGDRAPSVRGFRTDTVTDLRGTNIGGVPALFKSFTQQVGLQYDVFLETQPGSGLDYHYNNQLNLINRAWDNVVMHGQSNLNFNAPNNPALISQYTGLLGNVFQAQNANVDISMTATWSRADLTYQTSSPWLGAPITQMGIDVYKGYQVAAANNPSIVSRINPVGLAWNAAFAAGVADTNPYDGITTGQLNLWADDSYHASAYGYYLHALVVFGMETGFDPRKLGGRESAAVELGFTASEAFALQSLAYNTISAVPEPGTWATMGLGLGAIGWLGARRRKAAAAAA